MGSLNQVPWAKVPPILPTKCSTFNHLGPVLSSSSPLGADTMITILKVWTLRPRGGEGLGGLEQGVTRGSAPRAEGRASEQGRALEEPTETLSSSCPQAHPPGPAESCSGAPHLETLIFKPQAPSLQNRLQEGKVARYLLCDLEHVTEHHQALVFSPVN